MGEVQDAIAPQGGHAESEQQEQAAQMIQRNYRGYRVRRQLQGMGLDASARWAEVRNGVMLWNCTILTAMQAIRDG